MVRNIKHIGKELMGKSLNSFHRKTGLTQLEKNNKMQDGILNGILSQVDDAYIEKTEQSNVLHLDGSGDGVVVVDSIEGNTMVNLHPTDLKIGSGDGQDSSTTWHVGINMDKTRIKPNTYYTVFVLNSSSKVNRCYFNLCRKTVLTLNENKSSLFYTDDYERNIEYIHFYSTEPVPKSEVINTKIVVLEGDYTNCSINFIEGLQSSFEEKVNDEGKYEIEILMKNKNLFNKNKLSNGSFVTFNNKKCFKYVDGSVYFEYNDEFKENIQYTLTYKAYKETGFIDRDYNIVVDYTDGTSSTYQSYHNELVTRTTSPNKTVSKIRGNWNWGDNIYIDLDILQIEIANSPTEYVAPKSNKIKLLLNSPLLKGDKIVCKEDGLYHYHKMGMVVLDGSEDEGIAIYTGWSSLADIIRFNGNVAKDIAHEDKNKNYLISDKIATYSYASGVNYSQGVNRMCVQSVDSLEGKILWTLEKNKYTLATFKQELQANPVTVVYELAEPYYEKITNEYGEPIIMEGYENGTIYIDSTIVPTTTVRYTPKMESFKTYKEVKVRNAINDFDVTENVIPYMMEVDMKLTELEMSAISTYNIKNIRKMEVLDMTSMQERTFKMLERLIRGKSHTKQELIDRVLLYEQAKRITTEQALELNLIIEEVYGA